LFDVLLPHVALSLRASQRLYYDAVKIFMPAGAKQPVVVHYVEHMPPDVTAGIFWLKNRDPSSDNKRARASD
jgi:hypothetical protein